MPLSFFSACKVPCNDHACLRARGLALSLLFWSVQLATAEFSFLKTIQNVIEIVKDLLGDHATVLFITGLFLISSHMELGAWQVPHILVFFSLDEATLQERVSVGRPIHM